MGEKTFCRRVLPVRMRIRKMGIYCLRHRSRLIVAASSGIHVSVYISCHSAAAIWLQRYCARQKWTRFLNRHEGAWKRCHNFLRPILQRFFTHNIQYCAIINFTDMRFIFLMRLHAWKRFQMVVLHSASPILNRYLHAHVFIIKKWYGAADL